MVTNSCHESKQNIEITEHLNQEIKHNKSGRKNVNTDFSLGGEDMSGSYGQRSTLSNKIQF